MRTITFRPEIDCETFQAVASLYIDGVRVGVTYDPECVQSTNSSRKFHEYAELDRFYDTVKNLVKDLTPQEAQYIVKLVERK